MTGWWQTSRCPEATMLSKEVYADKPLGGYCYGWDSYLELEQQKRAYIIAADGSKTPLWVQDYWKDISHDNKVTALVRMLEASVERDMAAVSSHTGPVGIIYMDYAGMDKSPDYATTKLYKTVGMKLVDAVIKQNFE